MDFGDYQAKAIKTAIYPEVGGNILYPTLGLAGEAGEVAEIVKRIQRDKGGRWDSQDRQRIAQELGDVMWYVSAIASEFRLDLDEVGQANLEKLLSRERRDKLHGRGDDR